MIVDLKLCNRTDNRNAKEKSELISEAEVVILAGGHVPTQNIFFQQINLKNELKTSNKIIIDFSAGSMNCSEEVYAQPELQGESLEPNYKRFLKGLVNRHYLYSYSTRMGLSLNHYGSLY